MIDNSILVLAIGNDIIGDDGAAFAASDALRERFADGVDFENVYGGGLEILDIIEGRERVLVLDTISTERNPVGTILEFSPADFSHSSSSSPHYVGLPEVIKLAEMFNIEFPQSVKILAIETEFQNEITENLSPQIKFMLPHYIDRAGTIINDWLQNL